MKHYTIGFLFDSTNTRVALIKKQRPNWQRGKLNGIGGKLEKGEDELNCMVREFDEETGMFVETWIEFAVISNQELGYVLHCFAANGDLSQLRSKTDEKVAAYLVNGLNTRDDLVYHVSWLLEMCKASRATGLVYRILETEGDILGLGPLPESNSVSTK